MNWLFSRRGLRWKRCREQVPNFRASTASRRSASLRRTARRGRRSGATTPTTGARDWHRAAASRHARCGARSGKNGRPRSACAAGDRSGRNGLSILVRQGASAVGDRIQRRASAAATTSYYDLLASEARLCNFVAIAQGHLPQESWFALGRLLTSVGGEPVLLAWSGSMFEYLMPLLGDADLRKYRCSIRPTWPQWIGRSSMEGNVASPGGCRRAATTPSISTTVISIALSESRGWD